MVAEDSLQQHRLKSAIIDFGCEVVSLSPQTLALKGLDASVSAWLLDLREDDELLESFFWNWISQFCWVLRRLPAIMTQVTRNGKSVYTRS